MSQWPSHEKVSFLRTGFVLQSDCFCYLSCVWGRLSHPTGKTQQHHHKVLAPTVRK